MNKTKILKSSRDDHLSPHQVAVFQSSIGVWVAASHCEEPETGAWITPNDARKLARWLLKAADKAAAGSE